MASGTQKLIFATGEPAFAIDAGGAVVAWNAAASKAFGHRSAEALGTKCWDLMQGQDTFGNRYCSEHCPLREMAFQRKSVNRCRLHLRTAGKDLQEFTVTTLILFDTPDATLIHLCHREPAAAQEVPAAGAPGAPRRAKGILTARERQVLGHLADGHTTREIATLLSISVRTVRNHVEHILHKLNAHNRLEAVAVSRRLGLD